ncbi:Lipase 3 [Zootermopsis nevadensis]|uniref:Lipase 3 n=1 Tax=Zootermopsis nevadensis TaxID=136037 RepID=A0A067RCA9_ZOONE|nr:Lipase 3 [Zootermopsis nevadensis]
MLAASIMRAIALMMEAAELLQAYMAQTKTAISSYLYVEGCITVEIRKVWTLARGLFANGVDEPGHQALLGHLAGDKTSDLECSAVLRAIPDNGRAYPPSKTYKISKGIRGFGPGRQQLRFVVGETAFLQDFQKFRFFPSQSQSHHCSRLNFRRSMRRTRALTKQRVIAPSVFSKGSSLGRSHPELINRHGYPVESHTLVTEDGYQLTLHRIPYSAKFRRRHSPLDNNPLNSNEAGTESEPRGGRTDYAFETSGKPAVFLQHGVLASSLDWVLTGPHKALGYKLSDAGYDVWMGNLRGTIYSTRHKNFSNTQPEFWNYSWHEIGMYDLPAMVDYVLRVTGHPDLYFVGHSMGATVAVVMLSERPQYNDKLKITILLAPVVKLQHNTSIFRHSAPLWKALQGVSSYSGLHGFPPNPQLIQRRLEPVCEEQYIGRGLCANILHTVAGYSKELNQDVSWLADQFPNLVGNYLVPSESFSHLSFLWATNVDEILYDPMIRLLDRSSKWNHHLVADIKQCEAAVEPNGRSTSTAYSYVIRHKGARHTRLATVDLSRYQYVTLDVVAFMIVALAVTLCQSPHWPQRRDLNQTQTQETELTLHNSDSTFPRSLIFDSKCI